MSTNTRVTRSKGESDGLSLPVRTRQMRKSTNMENDGNTALNTTFDTVLDQPHPQMPVHTSTPPQADTVRMRETPVPTLPPAQQRPLTPRMPLPTSQNSYSSQMSAPLFMEDRDSSSSEDDLEMCDTETTQINR